MAINEGTSAGILEIFVDDDPLPLTGGGGSGQSSSTIGATTSGRGLFGITPRTRGRRRRNTPPSRGSFRRGIGGRYGQQSVLLPSWYPCTSFGDVTDIRQVLKLIFADIANEGVGESDQKKLLNSIDIFYQVVMKELHRLKRTPSAKKAERERKIRTLMSMR